ncbi:TerD family protein [Streptomyces sp. SS]|uniref:TerD family protein n=1 Tax=Streptomyces sp. SS TaxID=260742 RepID=UPI001ED9B9A6|nr:TerD family protein [Streptomyces sp. SS]
MGHTTESSWVPSVTLLVGIGNADIAALLLGADGRVRGDADMVFEGQPVHPSGAVQHKKKSLSLALHEVEPEVERIVIAGEATSGSLAATAPDRAVVLAWLIARPDDASAVVFGEFFRESGGWKFTGIGKGYASGLAELVTAYGVEVAEEDSAPGPMEKQAPGPMEKPVAKTAAAPPAAAAGTGPVPLTGVVKVPGRAPGQAPSARGVSAGAAGEQAGPPVPTGPFPPAERPYELVEGWEFGPLFEPFTVTGDGDQVVTVDGRVPPGPVLVETAHEGEGYFAVFPLDKRNKDGEYLFSTTLPHFTGSSVTPAPEGRALRLRVRAYNRWALRVKPVAAARRLDGTLRGYGAEALLYTGGAADLRVHFEGNEDGGGYVGMWCHEVAGHTALTPSPSLVVSDTDPLVHTVPLPPGPLLLLFKADGPWTLTVKEID